MVALGDPRVAAPFDVACPAPGTGRWVDPRTLGLRLRQGAARRHACARSPHGAASRRSTARPSRRSPSCSRPAARRSSAPSRATAGRSTRTRCWCCSSTAPSTTPRSPDHAWFTVQDLPERIPLAVLTGAERDAILRTLDDWQRQEPLVVVAARRRFPNAAPVSLVWDAGIRAPGGVATEHAADAALDRAPRLHRGVHLRARECDARVHAVPADAGAVLGAGLARRRQPRRPDRARRPALDAGRAGGPGLERRGRVPAALPRRHRLPHRAAARPARRGGHAAWRTRRRFRSRCAPTSSRRWRSSPRASASSRPTPIRRSIRRSPSPSATWSPRRPDSGCASAAASRASPCRTRSAGCAGWRRRRARAPCSPARRRPSAPSPSSCRGRPAIASPRSSASRSASPGCTSSSWRARGSAPRSPARPPRSTSRPRRW